MIGINRNLENWRTVRNIKNADTKVYVANVITEDDLEYFEEK